VLPSAAALLDGLFEHPEAIQFPTPCGKRNLILQIHRAYPQPAEVWELCFITWEGRKLQEGERRVACWSPVLAQRAVAEDPPGHMQWRPSSPLSMEKIEERCIARCAQSDKWPGRMVPGTYIWPYISQLDAGVEVANTKRDCETVPYVKGMSE
jgi:hypothetical protein